MESEPGRQKQRVSFIQKNKWGQPRDSHVEDYKESIKGQGKGKIQVLECENRVHNKYSDIDDSDDIDDNDDIGEKIKN